MWDQHYNPLNNAALSTIAAAIPVITLLAMVGVLVMLQAYVHPFTLMVVK